jgi:hypothetical protein
MKLLQFQIVELTNPSHSDSLWAASTVPKLRDNDSQTGSRGHILKMKKHHLGSLPGESAVEHGGAMSYLIALFKFGQMRATAINYTPGAIRGI